MLKCSQGYNSLRILDIHGNYIHTIIEEGTFKHLGSLELLILFDNDIDEIEDGAFTGLGNVIELDLSDNSGGVLGSIL